jgi:predicted SprT family Zn-dependent metalloprotease
MSDSLLKVITACVALHWMQMQVLWDKLKPYNAPKVRINNRLYRTAGLAFSEDHIVEFGSKFFNNYKTEMLCIIIPHELIHVADFIINGKDNTKLGHGPSWQRMMLEYGLPPDRYHNYIINKNDPIIKML